MTNRTFRIALGIAWIACLPMTHLTAQTRSGTVSGQLLLKPAVGVSEVQLHALLSIHQAPEVDRLPQLDVRIVRVPEKALDRVLTALRSDRRIEYVEKDFIATAVATANDPKFSTQWHLSKIQAPLAWDLTTGSNGPFIAVVDTGANYSHPDLKYKLLPGYDFVNGDTDASDDNGHGTGVSGTAAADSNNGIGVSSVAWGNLVMPLKVLDSSGSGSYSNISKAINYAADKGARIINLSLGGTSNSLTLQNAVNYAWKQGAVIIAAAGNNGNSTAMYPAACNNVLAVSATNSADTSPTWSNYGAYVDLCAPGEGIVTTYNNDYYSVSGTSFSSPVTAATVALMASIAPQLSNTQLVDLLLKSTDDLGAAKYDVYYGYGRVNVYKAVSAAGATLTNDTTLPVITSLSPEDGSILSGTVNVNISATDNVAVTKMEALINGSTVAQSSFGTLSFSWNTSASADGIYFIETRAFDAAGNVSSVKASVTVKNQTVTDVTAPVVAITSPKDGVSVSGMVKVQVISSDNVAVTRIELFIDAKLVGSSSSSSVTFNWNSRQTPKGEHKLQAYAYDAAGNIGASTMVTVRN